MFEAVWVEKTSETRNGRVDIEGSSMSATAIETYMTPGRPGTIHNKNNNDAEATSDATTTTTTYLRNECQLGQ